MVEMVVGKNGFFTCGRLSDRYKCRELSLTASPYANSD